MEASPNHRLGTYIVSAIGGETVRSYVPPPLPPVPAVGMGQLQLLLEQANQALGRLDGFTSVLPDLSLFLYAYVRKEALLSSQIEGTQSSFSDLVLFENSEAPGVPIQDVQDVSNYVAALNHGMRRLREGFPISLRLIREIHGVLLSEGRGSNKEPGEFRRSQNWIGGTRPGNAAFVPPPADRVMECMGQLEIFLHEERRDIPLLIKAGLAHVQFETIHPFLDGNGRLGRLLITLHAVRKWRASRADSVPEPLSEDTQGDILRTSDRSAIERRLGNMARILLDGGEGDIGPSSKFRTSDLGFN